MTTSEFANIVFAMREAQKEYFKYRSNEALKRSKELEKQVDSILLSRKKAPKIPPNRANYSNKIIKK